MRRKRSGGRGKRKMSREKGQNSSEGI